MTPTAPIVAALAVLSGPHAPAPAESWGEGVPLWVEDDFAQELHAVNFREVWIVDRARDPATGEWVEVERARATTSYRAWKFAPAHVDVLGVAGFAPNGDVVIERWDLVPTGAPPGPEAADLPERLRTPKRFDRTTLYRGPLGEGLHGLGFELHGRYLLALVKQADGAQLVRFDSASPAIPRVVLDSATLPELAAMRTLDRFRHRTLGPVWRMQDHPLAYTTRIVLADRDGEGVFDAEPLVGDGAWFDARGLARAEDWDSLTYFPRGWPPAAGER